MADHDHSYKQLFSHAELVRDLLQGFVQEAWIADLDLSTAIPAIPAIQGTQYLFLDPLLSPRLFQQALPEQGSTPHTSPLPKGMAHPLEMTQNDPATDNPSIPS